VSPSFAAEAPAPPPRAPTQHQGPRRWRDGAIIYGTIGIATVLAWAYVVGVSGVQPRPGGLALAFGLSMWAVMMAGMMLPSAAPMVVTFAAVSRRRAGRYAGRTTAFVAGYLAVWTGFSVLGAGAQWAFRSAALLSPAGALTSPLLAGGLLIGAGAYQLSPLKNACLHRCRTPMGFLVMEWRTGADGAVVMGLRHGVECVLCCWGIMALMFVFGVMDLRWMAALTLFMVLEKVLPGGDRLGRVAGGLSIASGALWSLAEVVV
jgi:predicted metal-binding membrane protein